ncbi:transposase [Aestuariicoccus sp. MJ-SS9]|uniref:transposase n=1 Tax=Aestuariicoccus sp. MJ-SS9 TaxID=3079855 RepID=UPI00290B2395|nr:transposase [Aestuariicoccus sp. MJ-SS9]MDU8911005.1 transposase [Aestuariicoccus sp. MJ-SS9]
MPSNGGSKMSSRRSGHLPRKRNCCDLYPGLGPVFAAMLIAALPELCQLTSGEAASMAGLAPIPYDSVAMRGKRTIAKGRCSLRHVPFQAALAAACHDPALKPVAKRLKERGKSYSSIVGFEQRLQAD